MIRGTIEPCSVGEQLKDLCVDVCLEMELTLKAQRQMSAAEVRLLTVVS